MGTQPTVRGQVVESLPNLLYKVQLDTGRMVTCYLAGKMKLHKIKVIIGDVVEVVLDEYGGQSTNRIVLRVNQEVK